MVIDIDCKKILLELYYHKYLLYKNTLILIVFSYLVALLVTFLTRQLSLFNMQDVILISIISSVFIVIVIISLNEVNYHLSKIPQEIKRLNCIY